MQTPPVGEWTTSPLTEATTAPNPEVTKAPVTEAPTATDDDEKAASSFLHSQILGVTDGTLVSFGVKAV